MSQIHGSLPNPLAEMANDDHPSMDHALLRDSPNGQHMDAVVSDGAEQQKELSVTLAEHSARSLYTSHAWPSAVTDADIVKKESKTNSGAPSVLVCRWQGCHQTFQDISELVHHLSEDHIGKKKTPYFCEWAGCIRYGLPQASRFSLMSHLRCHTGEKPFSCPHCHRSFPRSDAMAKHVKSKHGDADIGEVKPPLHTEKPVDEYHVPSIESDPLKLSHLLMEHHIPLLVQELTIQSIPNKRKKDGGSEKIESSITFQGKPLNRRDKSLMAEYYVQLIEQRDLFYEYETLQKKIQRLTKEIDLIIAEIWP